MTKTSSVYDKLFVLSLVVAPVAIAFFCILIAPMGMAFGPKENLWDSAVVLAGIPAAGSLLYIMGYFGVKVWRGS